MINNVGDLYVKDKTKIKIESNNLEYSNIIIIFDSFFVTSISD